MLRISKESCQKLRRPPSPTAAPKLRRQAQPPHEKCAAKVRRRPKQRRQASPPPKTAPPIPAAAERKVRCHGPASKTVPPSSAATRKVCRQAPSPAKTAPPNFVARRKGAANPPPAQRYVAKLGRRTKSTPPRPLAGKFHHQRPTLHSPPPPRNNDARTLIRKY